MSAVVLLLVVLVAVVVVLAVGAVRWADHAADRAQASGSGQGRTARSR